MLDHISIENELKKSYLEYSLAVIVGRAIPDVRDGLKPVHRRILFAMHELSNTYNRPYKKSARVVGDVIGKYHPHGDSAVYDALVRMAQEFSMRDPIVDGQGNFGSIDGDSAAAMRYTEVRMSRLASEFLADIEKETVEYRPNYDNSLNEPAVLPTKVPNLLLNGSSGIAVGMATNIPPHNLGELCDGLLLIIDKPDCPVDDVIACIPGPDFPTGAAIYCGQGLLDAYRTGRGSIKIRGNGGGGNPKKGHELVVIREIPYALNKSTLVEKIAQLVQREEDRQRLRPARRIRPPGHPHRAGAQEAAPSRTSSSIPCTSITPLETSFGINMLVVGNNQPLTCEHQADRLNTSWTTARRWSSGAPASTCARARSAPTSSKACASPWTTSTRWSGHHQGLQERCGRQGAAHGALRACPTSQAQAILDMRLQRLTNLERQKLLDELSRPPEAHRIPASPSWRTRKSCAASSATRFASSRRNTPPPARPVILTEKATEGIDIEDLIPDENVVITLSRRGYIKRTPLDTYQQQRRGGKGIAGVHTSSEDFIQSFSITTNHQHLLLFTNLGKMHQLKVHQIPEGSRTAKGMHIANLLPMDKEEFVATAMTIREFSAERFFLFVTRKGMIKRSAIDLYKNCRVGGIRAVNLNDGDHLLDVKEVPANAEIILATELGLAIRFVVGDVRPMGRSATGVRGIALRGGDKVASGVVVDEGPRGQILTVAANGFGKRTDVEHYRLQSRGGKGVINMKVTHKTGNVIGAVMVSEADEVLLLTSGNKIIRMRVDEISNVGRAAQGVTLVRMDEGEQVMGFDLVDITGVFEPVQPDVQP